MQTLLQVNPSPARLIVKHLVAACASHFAIISLGYNLCIPHVSYIYSGVNLSIHGAHGSVDFFIPFHAVKHSFVFNM